MKVTAKLINIFDRVLGRILLRSCAILAFMGAAAGIVFGAIVLADGHIPGVLLLLLGAVFTWLGLLAWRDRATLGEVLNRDFEKMTASKQKRSGAIPKETQPRTRS